jgi:DNA helicase-2/ATP-dependent DNA helicase PcrA
MKDLNSAQQEAVDYVGGPLLIVAGAGTGKTAVITQKIASLIERKLALPEEVLALTFTDKAAAEMRERVDGLVGSSYASIEVSTFHSFCQRILEDYALDIGLPNRFKLLTTTETWLLVREKLDRFKLDYYRPMANPERHIHELIKHFSKCKDELVSPEDYLAHAESVAMETGDMNAIEKNRLSEVANAYHVYNRILLENNAFDFGDLLFYVVKLFRERPQILAKVQRHFKFILVDEFQDVNWAQYVLVRLLANEQSQLTVVGDDDQSIYAFRGASVSNILRFKDDFPNAKNIVLTDNYRSQQSILDAAYCLIQNNNPDRLEVKLNIDKHLTAQLPVTEKGLIEHISVASLNDEVQAVIEKIAELKNLNSETKWSDFAVLARANGHLEPFVDALGKAGIPYEFLASSGLYSQSSILDCLNFFKAIVNNQDSTAIYRLITMPFLHLSAYDLQKFTYLAKKKSVPYAEALKRAREFGLSEEGVQVIERVRSFLNAGARDVTTKKPSILLLGFLDASGYKQFLVDEDVAGRMSISRQALLLTQFLEEITAYEISHPGEAHVAGFLEHFNHVVESGDEGSLKQNLDVTHEAVRVMTVHASKGLEFKYVFIVNVVEERFPTRRRGEAIELPRELIKEQLPSGDGHYEEERRLMYVAVTRAKDRLYCTSASDYGGVRAKKVSRFLHEMNCANGETKLFVKEGSAFAAPSPEKIAPFIYDKPATFSFSQLKSYETCPYQYKLGHVIKIPQPTGNASFSFGQTMHSTLQKFYERMQELNSLKQVSLFSAPSNDKVDGEIKVPSFDELLKIYEGVWIEDWYKDKQQREEYYVKGKEILRTFYTSHEGVWNVPVTLEGSFKIKVGDYLINGRIDRIDQLPDGSLEIIDYKTGKPKEKIVGDDKDQLLIYQIATEELPQYHHLGKTQKLTFYYLNDNSQISFVGTEKELSALKEKLIETINQIRSGDFTPTPSAFVCGSCPYKDICAYRVL